MTWDCLDFITQLQVILFFIFGILAFVFAIIVIFTENGR